MGYNYPFNEADENTKRTVWEKGEKISDKDEQHWDPATWRWDKCGKPIKYSEHGNTKSKFGWEIDHINPKANGGTDDLDNLQPLQWENNRNKGDDLSWSCP